jgi:hypothetical protein
MANSDNNSFVSHPFLRELVEWFERKQKTNVQTSQVYKECWRLSTHGMAYFISQISESAASVRNLLDKYISHYESARNKTFNNILLDLHKIANSSNVAKIICEFFGESIQLTLQDPFLDSFVASIKSVCTTFLIWLILTSL